MKKILVALAGVLAITTMSVQAAEWSTVRLGVDATYPPFESKDASGKLVGFEVELGDAVCKEMKVKCEWIVQDWDGIIPGLLARKYDAIFSSMSITPERAQQVAFTEPYYNTPSGWWAKKGTAFNTKDLTTLAGARVGVQRGTIQDTYASKNLEGKATVVRYTAADEFVIDLFAGRLDLILIDVPVGEELLAGDDRGAGYAMIGTEPLGDGAAAAMRKRDTDLLDMFNKALRTVKSNGVYDKIRVKYFSYDIKM